jgi:Ca2+-transporting ATPase
LLSSIPRGGAIQDPGSKAIESILKEWFVRHPKITGSSVSPFYYPDKLLSQGLTEAEARALRAVYGTNAIEEPPPPSWWALIAEQFEDKLVRILVGVALLSALLEVTSGGGGSGSAEAAAVVESLWHRFAEPLVISFLLVVNASVGVWQSKSAGNSIEALKAMQPSLCTVLRRVETASAEDDQGGESGSTETTTTATTTATTTTQEIADCPAEQLVPGDLIVLKTGDKVPADCRLVRYYNGRRSLSVDETCLTGESLSVEKLLGEEGLSPEGSPVQSQRGMVFAGTTVVSGGGLALVVATGTSTEFGTIQSGVMEAKKDAHDQKTPLAKQLDDFGGQLTGLIGGVCALVWLASVPKMFARDNTVFANPLEGMVYYAKVAVALGVAAIPEGLPAVITLCLSLGTRRMAQRNVLVRNLPSVETLGCVSVICSDKTGTLTTNEMTVTSLVLLEKQTKKHIVEHGVEGVSYSPFGAIEGVSPPAKERSGGKNKRPKKIEKSSSLLDIVAVASLCNDAIILGHDKDTDNPSHAATAASMPTNTKDFERNGEPTEAALCVLAEKLSRAIETNNNNNSSSRGGKGSDNNLEDKSPTKKNNEVASYYVDRMRNTYSKTATLEFHRERKSEL